jgi:HD-GYP domain-containing protein (c-di-GMP phosphodiesterase class II)
MESSGMTSPPVDECPTAIRTGTCGVRPAPASAPLMRELRRCHGQLELVFGLTGELARAHDPDTVQAELLRRYGVLLQTEAVYLDCGGDFLPVLQGAAGGPQPVVPPDRVREVLSRWVEQARRDGRPHVPALSAAEVEGLGGAHVLLAPLARRDGETAVVIALRGAADLPFDERDARTAGSVLTFGTQVLNEALTVRHLQRTALETVSALVNAIDAKDNYTSAHSERVGGLARLTGTALKLDDGQIQALECSGLLHDVGKIGVPEEILNKPGALTPAEFEEMKKHARVGYEMLRPVAQFQPILKAVLHHHENHDGSGYPKGLAGDAIPLGARIIHVVDIFDALTTSRPYRKAYDVELALRVIEAGAGRDTDPAVTESFIQALHRHRAQHPAHSRARVGHLVTDSAGACSVN